MMNYHRGPMVIDYARTKVNQLIGTALGVGQLGYIPQEDMVDERCQHSRDTQRWFLNDHR